MNIETPLQAVRRLTGLSDTYVDAIYESFISLRGSSDLQADFSAARFPLTNYTRTNRKTMTGDATSTLASGSATFASTAADADLIMVSVGKLTAESAIICTIGGTINSHIKVGTQASAPARFNDGTNTDIANVEDADPRVDPEEGDIVIMIGARDHGTDAYAYAWNFTKNAVAWSFKTVSAGTSSGAITPSANTMAVNDWAEFYGAICFEFANGELPTTWKADMIAMAQTLITTKT